MMKLIVSLLILILLPFLSTDAVAPHFDVIRMSTSDPLVTWAAWFAIVEYNKKTNNNLDLKIVKEALDGKLSTGGPLLQQHILLKLEAVNHASSCSVDEYIAYLIQYTSDGSTFFVFLTPSSDPSMKEFETEFETAH